MDLREQLAALAHEQWAAWMAYLFEQSRPNDDGSVTIPASLAARWRRQVASDYAGLPDEERESDRIEADKVLEIVRAYAEAKKAQ